MTEKLCHRCDTEMTRAPGGRLYCKSCTTAYRNTNKDKVRSYLDKYRAANREKNVEYQKEYRDKNKELLALKFKVKYRKNNPIPKPVSKYGNYSKHPDYGIWSHIKSRCSNPSHPDYQYYGGRGIGVCERWVTSFDNFLDDMGPRPEPRYLYSIDRWPDKNGNYEPGNCRWATVKEQNTNRRQRRNKNEVRQERYEFQEKNAQRLRALSDKSEISDESLIYYPYGNLTDLKTFSETVGIPLVVCKYRYAQDWSAEFILNGSPHKRIYPFKGNLYELQELALLSGLPYSAIYSRIRTFRWDVDRAMNTPFQKSQK